MKKIILIVFISILSLSYSASNEKVLKTRSGNRENQEMDEKNKTKEVESKIGQNATEENRKQKSNLVEQKCLGKQNFNLEKGICECAGRENLNNTDQMLICNFNPINCTYDPVDADNVWPTMQKSFESVAGNLPENLLNFTLSLTSVMNQTLTNIAETFEFVFSNLENLKFDFNT